MSPIHPEDRDRYPANWREISDSIRFDRAGGECECTGECGDTHPRGRCRAPHGERIVRAKGRPSFWAYAVGDEDQAIKVILTVAHLDHTPENCEPENLRAMCQRCHLRYDRAHHAASRRRRTTRSSSP